MPNQYDITTAAALLQGDAQMVDSSLDLDLNGYIIRVRSNHQPLLKKLTHYFEPVVASDTGGEADIEVLAVEREVMDSGLDFTDWTREAGKSGRKDSYFDLHDARVVRKVRTGMLFLQSNSLRIAAGPCLENDNQLINFICSQYMSWLQQREWLICHASGLVAEGRGIGIAGFSGGGKSTLMLNLLENEPVNFLTNDRLFIHATDGKVSARGIPKMPRINPGTIVNNKRLHSLLSTERREALLQLPAEELWVLEEKYDALIPSLYGPQRVTTDAPLDAFVILNWKRDSADESRVTEIDINQRQELLAALMKSPGPFYQNTDGDFLSQDATVEPQRYLQALNGVTIYEVTGKVDFDAIEAQLSTLLAL
ncbi:MAG: HprK-related kinase B [Gammaproteobacteria bacterium]|nr:HprK-related kinase B [Thiotrichales bacterium]MBT7022389.1 HprK-related kinase B [Gammaproteobacteria bacterium]